MLLYGKDDVQDYVSAQGDDTFLRKYPHICRRLIYVIEYAKVQTSAITDTTTINDIVRAVHAANNARYPSSGSGGSTSSTSDSKKTVPTLAVFSGQDGDYFGWKEDVMNTLGAGGLADYVTSATANSANPDVGKSVFFALRQALSSGTASHLSTKLFETDNFDPHALWTSVHKYYDTPVNRANTILHQIRKLLNLRMDPGSSPASFVNEFNKAVLQLRKNKAKIADDTDFLRALLLEAIQDDEFEQVRENILGFPNKGPDKILEELRTREASLGIKDGTRNGFASRASRRTNHNNHQRGGSRGGDRHGNDGSQNWRIPYFPKSWEKMMGAKFFNLLVQWRSLALKQQAPQSSLNQKFEVDVQPLGTTHNKKRKMRRGNTKEDDDDDGDTTMKEEAADDNNKKQTPRFVVRLRESRRIVTERNI